MKRWVVIALALSGWLALPGPLRAEVPMPEEDLGVWAAKGQSCESGDAIILTPDAIIVRLKGRLHEFPQPVVAIDYYSGSAAESIAHGIFSEKGEPAFLLIMFPGENRNRLIYEVIRPERLLPDFPRKDTYFRRCGKRR